MSRSYHPGHYLGGMDPLLPGRDVDSTFLGGTGGRQTMVNRYDALDEHAPPKPQGWALCAPERQIWPKDMHALSSTAIHDLVKCRKTHRRQVRTHTPFIAPHLWRSHLASRTGCLKMVNGG